jgi:hypothetical protein
MQGEHHAREREIPFVYVPQRSQGDGDLDAVTLAALSNLSVAQDGVDTERTGVVLVEDHLSETGRASAQGAV